MAEGDMVIYNDFKERLMYGQHILSGNTFTVTLHTAYTPNIDTHQVWADVSGTEYPTAAGYTQGGKTLANMTVTQDNVNDRAAWDADDVLWSALGPLTPATPSHAIIKNNTPASPSQPLVSYVVLGVTATNGGNYTLQWNVNGLILLT